jgi:hypothetical protein
MHLSGTPLERLNILVEREGRSNGNTQVAPPPPGKVRSTEPRELMRVIAASEQSGKVNRILRF